MKSHTVIKKETQDKARLLGEETDESNMSAFKMKRYQVEIDFDHYWNARDFDTLCDEALVDMQSVLPKKQNESSVTASENGIDASLNSIESELLSAYKIRITTDPLAQLTVDKEGIRTIPADSIPLLIEETFSPRLRFLLQKRNYLNKLNAAISSEFIQRSIKIKREVVEQNQNENQEKKSVLRSVLLSMFNIGKKIVDLVDDIWSAMRRVLAQELVEMVNPFLVSITGGIINAVEGVLGLKRAYKAYNDGDIGQRYSRIFVGVVTFILGAIGTAVAGGLIASALGAAVLGSIYFPIIVPGILIGIYTLSLLRKSYTFDQVKKQEKHARDEYQQCVTHNLAKLNELNSLREELRNEHIKMQKFIVPILQKINLKKQKDEKENLSEQEQLHYDRYRKLLTRQDECDQQYHKLQANIEPLRQVYEHYHEQRLNAERKVAMNTVEVFASLFVFSGIVLGASAILGATTVASFGIVPLALIVTGVVIGVCLKIFEKVDEKKGHKVTAGIRNFFTSAWDKLFHKPENKPEFEPEKRMSSTGTVFSSILQRRIASKDDTATISHPAKMNDQFLTRRKKSNTLPSSLWDTPYRDPNQVVGSDVKFIPSNVAKKC